MLLCDAMFGELARWLRLRGYDTLFMPDTPDLDIVRRARYDGRIVLTQDAALSRHPAIEAVLIPSDDLNTQLERVREQVGDPPEGASPRCVVCNTALTNLPKPAAKNRVPPYVHRTVDSFSECASCRRVFWKGTHWEGIEERLD